MRDTVLIGPTGQEGRAIRVREEEGNIHHAHDMDPGHDRYLLWRHVYGTHLHSRHCHCRADHLFQGSYCDRECAK